MWGQPGEQGDGYQGLTELLVDEFSHLLLSDGIRAAKETQQHHQANGKGFHPPTYSSEMENPSARVPPSLGLLRVKEMKQERPQEDCIQRLPKLFEGLESIKETQQPKEIEYIKGKLGDVHTHLKYKLSVGSLPNICEDKSSNGCSSVYWESL